MTKKEFTEKCKTECKDMAAAMKSVRKKRGYTPTKMAEEIGVTPDYIHKIERNDEKIPAFMVSEYCRILHVPAEVFYQTGYSPSQKNQIGWIRQQLPSLPDSMLKTIRTIIFNYIEENVNGKD